MCTTGATREDEISDPFRFSHKPRESRANNERRFMFHEARTHLCCVCYDDWGGAMIRNLTSSTRVSADVRSPAYNPQW